ncbi:hypothetical protein L0F63_001167 [Massospora cicadina]|nr:hypothetical protein L0F63_001167 [Massospora cicadina]
MDPLLLHRLIFKRDLEGLKRELANPTFTINHHSIEFASHQNGHPLVNRPDHRGCTPLHLAIMTGQKAAVKLLIRVGGASVLINNAHGWSCIDEAVSYADREIIMDVLLQKQLEITRFFRDQAPRIAHELSQELDNVRVELHWNFKSWVPLVSNMCPSDTYVIWKKVSHLLSLRIDTTLVGFEKLRWQRGRQTFLFHAEAGQGATLTVVDHTRKLTQRIMTYRPPSQDEPHPTYDPELEEEASIALNSKITLTNIPASSISFRREYVGVWGFRNPRVEKVSGYDCEVWKINNIELRSRIRTEHLGSGGEEPDGLGLDEKLRNADAEMEQLRQFCPSQVAPPRSEVTYETYFDPSSSSHIHLGRPWNCKDSCHTFNATVWMAPTSEASKNPFPVTLRQLKPLLDVASLSSDKLVAKLGHFIDTQVPPGFPVKAIVPIFPMLSIQTTFGSIACLSPPLPDSHFQVPGPAQGYSPGVVLTKLSSD